MTAPFRTQRRVEFRETDMAGIVHFSNYFVWMEQAEHELWRQLGLGVVTRVDGEPLSWPRVAAECNYRRALRFEDLIDVQLGIARIGTSSIVWRTRFLHGGELVADGSMTSVCCRVLHGAAPESRPIPATIRERLQAFLWPAD